MKRDLSDTEVFTARVRALQAIYAPEHGALQNWGAYSRDRYGIGPKDGRNGMWDQFSAANCDPEGWGEEVSDKAGFAPQTAAAKADPSEREEYDEKSARILCERLHGPGGINLEYRRVLKVAYVSRSVPEYQMPRLSNCSTPDEFCYRLECILQFTRRWV